MSDAVIIDLIVTGTILLVEIALVLFCYIQTKKPVDPLKPRLIPYPLLMIVLVAAILATVAHIVSLLTGQQVQPRRPKGMR